ncbi:MAG: hypothetical protein CVT62_07300 [Actinobacteria bacterium HGW-Actinobacteria-2]|nr:MAG: hypothetical protein CVT62_07300 [Actinobacteria bacterium HGW-Actinobacteria-2]
MDLARETGAPVVVTAKTDETTLITADPVTGNFTAELSARPVRVRDGNGGWRAASARLVKAPDGSWRTEAGVAEVTVSNGGAAGVVASLRSDSVSASVSWPDALPVPVVEDTTATYPEVYPGVDLVVRADVDAVETFLVVKTPSAGRNPKVREWSMPISTPGLTTKTLENGVRSLVDGSGTARMVIPPAVMWDSAGKTSNLTHAADRLEELAQTKSAPVGLKVASNRLTASPEDSFLDDPATVYPVVIDPVLQSIDQTHVLRVTDDWSKWDSAVGSQGKIGYNGWTSPYYRSRMFYQFAWPASGLLPQQVIQGQFQYKQVHSVQHSPCLSTSSTYPTVKARLANAISSTDTWSDRTGTSWHDQASVAPNTTMAVGHIDYCGKTYTEVWDLTSTLRTERQNYASRTTVTVGLYSADEGNKNGWKYYSNSDGNSPKLLLTYQVGLPTISGLGFSPALDVSTTNSTAPTLSATVSLSSGGMCVTTAACLKARFSVSGPGVSATYESAPVGNGSLASVTLPSNLSDLSNYQISVNAVSLDTGLVSPVSQRSIYVLLPTPPSAPSGVKLLDGAGNDVVGTVAYDTNLGIGATMPSGALCRAEAPSCLSAKLWFKDGQQEVASCTLSGLPPGQYGQCRPPVALSGGHNYEVCAATLKGSNGTWSPAVCSTFNVFRTPEPPTLTGLDPEGLVARFQVSDLDAGVTTVSWLGTWNPASGESESVVGEVPMAEDGVLEIPVNGPGTLDIKVIAGRPDSGGKIVYGAESDGAACLVGEQ